MRISLIFNPDAGDQEPSLEAIERELERAGYDADPVQNKKARFKRILRDPGEFLVAAGGDGTVARIAAKLAGRQVPLAILPIGTANNIARALGVPRSLRRAVASWRRARRSRIDLGAVSFAKRKKPKLLLESAGVGLMPRAFEALSSAGRESEKPMSEERAVQGFLNVLEKHEPRGARVRIDGEEIEDEYLLVEVMNIPSIGPNLELAPGADPSDGMFEVVTATERERRALEEYLGARLRGRRKALALPTRRGREIEIEPDGRGAVVHIDGKVREIESRRGRGLVSVRLHARGVHVLTPFR